MALWEVANGKISVLLFTSWWIIKSFSSMKLTRINLFRLYFTEKTIEREGTNIKRFERSDSFEILREVIWEKWLTNTEH